MSTSSGSSSKANGLEHYTIDHRSAFGSLMAGRTAQANAAFFLPHLREGIKLLDCGCGSGSITIGFAKAVTGISVVGVDLQESEIHAAEVFKAVLLAPRLIEDVVSLGWATKEKYEEMGRAIDGWCTHPDFFHTYPWIEATAWKGSRPELK